MFTETITYNTWYVTSSWLTAHSSYHDIYDFNMLPWSKETIMRNIEAKIGNIVNGSGSPYMIWIYGKTKVNP